MQYWIYISSGFVAFQLINVLLNFLFRQKIADAGIQNHQLISVLIPARNEEANIGTTLDALHQIKSDHVEIIVFDDHSSDHTVQIVKQYSEKDSRIQLIQSVCLPSGWQGKNHACYQLSQQARGKYFLFIDADVKLHGNILADAVAYLKNYELGLLSVFPRQIQKSIGEKMSVPIMHYVLLTLLPLIFVRLSPFKAHAAANGQFMLFDAETYKKLQPHLQCKASPVEDIAISRYYKEQKVKIACVTGEERIECKMYSSYNDALRGFSKNIFMFFGNIPVLAFLFWFCAAAGIVPFVVLHVNYVAVYVSVVILIQVLYAITSKQNTFATILFFPVHLFFMFHLMINGWVVQQTKKYTWKGRNIY